MVSFSCEGCGDVLTKKKLDPHRNQCYGASFTCLDCMVHFQGNEYRSHTSCISEAQKYQGALYRPEKEKKGAQQQGRNNSNNRALVPQKAYVEEIPDEYTGAVSQYQVLPEAPDPPSAAPDFVPDQEQVNVFDFMVGSETPNPSTLNLVSSGVDESRMISATPHTTDKRPTVRFYDDEQAAGMIVQYGNGPLPSGDSYLTPAPKHKEKKDKSEKSATKDKKRKRLHVDTSPQPPLHRNGEDAEMQDADGPPILHSGLTGGLNRLLRPSQFPPSPDYSGGSGGHESPTSPLKRSKRESRQREKVEEKSRSHGISDTIMNFIGAGPARKERERDGGNKENEHEDRPRKSRNRDRERERHPNDQAVSRSKSTTSSSHHPKLLEYPSSPTAEDGQMIRYSSTGTALVAASNIPPSDRATLFLSGVTKGTESEKGYSVNKALKRYHRERGGQLGALGKKEWEEKELWRCLRLRRNDRGEVVVFFAD